MSSGSVLSLGIPPPSQEETFVFANSSSLLMHHRKLSLPPFALRSFHSLILKCGAFLFCWHPTSSHLSKYFCLSCLTLACDGALCKRQTAMKIRAVSSSAWVTSSHEKQIKMCCSKSCSPPPLHGGFCRPASAWFSAEVSCAFLTLGDFQFLDF